MRAVAAIDPQQRIFVLLLLLLLSGRAGGQLPFTEEAIARGVNYVTPFGNWDETFGYGMALNDFDGDNDLDLILTGRGDGVLGIYENNGSGVFTDRTGGIPISDLSYNAISAADYDADGDLDIYVSRWLAPNVLLRNDGAFQFTDVTAMTVASLGDSGAGAGTCWGDYDGDGWLDLYVTNRTETMGDLTPNRLFRNLGGGTFEDVGATLGVEDSCVSFQAAWLDYDRDGDADLYLSNDKGSVPLGCTNRLWENTPTGFVDVSLSSGTGVAIDSMGVAIADYDGNGFQDIYCTNVPVGNPLLMAGANGVFTDEAFAYGVTSNRSGWGTHFLDFNHDGRLDLFVATSVLEDQLFQGLGPGLAAIDVSASSGLPMFSDSFCSAVGDIDNDGDVDLVVQERLQPIKIYINHASTASSWNWLKVRLHGAWPNLDAIGAIVDVSAPLIPLNCQEVRAGVSYKSSSSFVLHFGLRTNLAASVTVTWPGGATTVLTSVAANQTIDVYETNDDCNVNGIHDYQEIAAGAADENSNWTLDLCEDRFQRGDCNGDDSLDIADAICSLENFSGSSIAPCQRALDANFDDNVDIADPVYLLLHLFASGPAPAQPFPNCGVDPQPMTPLSCLSPPLHCNQ